MIMELDGQVLAYDVTSGRLILEATYMDADDFERKQYKTASIQLDDGRHLTAQQRRKARAIINDIAQWAGYRIKDETDNLHEIMKAYFCAKYNRQMFSLADCSMTTAREYINYLIDFCIENGVPSMDSLINRTDDIDAYLYSCLYHRRCCICGRPADVHHVDRVGMGNNRNKINHVGMRAMALCRIHHDEAHRRGQTAFDEYHHVYGIELDEHLVKRLEL